MTDSSLKKEKKKGCWDRKNIIDLVLQKVISRKLFVTLVSLLIFLTPWLAALCGLTLSPILTENNMTLILLVFIGAQSAQDITALLMANKGTGGSSLTSFLASAKKTVNQPAADPALPDGPTADPTIATAPPVDEEEEGA